MSSYQRLRTLSEDRGGNQANLNGALLKALKIPAPGRADQIDIVRRIKVALAELDAMERACKASLEEINQLPNRLLSQPFSPQGALHA